MRFENTWQDIRNYSFIQNHSRPFRFTAPWRCFFSHLTHVLQGSTSPHSSSTGFRSEDWNGHDSRSLVLCSVYPFCVVFEVVFGLLYGWKIQHGPITRFLTESVTCWFLSVDIWYNAWCHVSKHDVQDLQQKYRPTLNLKYSSIISLYTWGTFYPCVHQTHLQVLLLKPICSVCCPDLHFTTELYVYNWVCDK